MAYKLKWTNALVLLVVFALAACSSAPSTQPAQNAPEPSATQAQEAAATLPPVEPTATTAPTNTEAPTFTPSPSPLPPTETPTPAPSATLAAGVAKEGISGWCIPENVLVSAASDPLSPPAKANIGVIEKDALEIRNMPFSACVFLYTFKQPAPSGLKLEIYDINQKTPWWKTDLNPVNGKPEAVYTLLRHTYIINPPLWSVGYDFVVRDANGAELQRNRVNLHRWETGLCWQGTLPDPVTLYCPLQQDLHPWDVGYGKKLPTVTPKP